MAKPPTLRPEGSETPWSLSRATCSIRSVGQGRRQVAGTRTQAPSHFRAARSLREGSAPLIAHVVLFRLRPEVPASDRQALMDAFATALRDIPTIRRAQVGRRVLTGRSYEQMMRTDFPYMVILEFDDISSVKAYLDHAAHKEVSARFFETVAESLIYDFEIEGSGEGLRGVV